MLTLIKGIFCVWSPGRFPCANWLLAVAQNLPPPDPPNQSGANASFIVLNSPYNLFSESKPPPHQAQKLQFGQPADQSLRHHLPSGHVATI